MYRGPTLQHLATLDDPLPLGAQSCFGWALLVADLDGDGRPELVVGTDTADVGGVFNAGRITVFP